MIISLSNAYQASWSKGKHKEVGENGFFKEMQGNMQENCRSSVEQRVGVSYGEAK